MSKSVQIVTLWSAMNYGAFLQAYALGRYCESLGADVTYLRDTKEKKCFIFMISKNIKKTIYQYKLLYSFWKTQQWFRLSSSNRNVYMAIVGSDEIWNVSNSFFKHLSAYIGVGLSCNKIISYAASCNGVTRTQFCEVYGPDPFRKFDAISVRDKSTQELVNSITGTKPQIVLDPTFLIDDYSSIVIKPKYENYILVYGYSFSTEEINEIKRFASKKNLKLISAGAYLKGDWINIRVPASPFLFLGLIKYSDYVITSTFHGTVFSVIFNKEFITFARDNSKIKDLLAEFKIDNRNASLNKDVEKVFAEAINYSKINDLISVQKRNAKQFLRKQLEENT